MSPNFNLTPDEKLQLIEVLWDDLASNPHDVPLHDWQIAALARRKQLLDSNPTSGLSWEDVEKSIRDRYGR